MRIVLDECMSRQIGRLLPDREVTTVQRLGGAGMKNGQLLTWLRGKCDLFVTTDRGLAYDCRGR